VFDPEKYLEAAWLDSRILPRLQNLELLNAKAGYSGLNTIAQILQLRVYQGLDVLHTLRVSCRDFAREEIIERAYESAHRACIAQDIGLEVFEPSALATE
jgi:hypothetical protein